MTLKNIQFQQNKRQKNRRAVEVAPCWTPVWRGGAEGTPGIFLTAWCSLQGGDSMSYTDLADSIENRMRMSHIYQPARTAGAEWMTT